MQHMVSLVQLGVLRSVCAGCELHCNSPPAHTLLKTPSCTKDTICCICKGNCKFCCSWRWAYRPETCRAKINKYLHQVGNWLLFQTKCKVQPSKIWFRRLYFLKCTHARPDKQMIHVWLVIAYKEGQYLNVRFYLPECHDKARSRN